MSFLIREVLSTTLSVCLEDQIFSVLNGLQDELDLTPLLISNNLPAVRQICEIHQFAEGTDETTDKTAISTR